MTPWYLEQQFDDLVLPLGGSLVQRGELPQVGHVDVGAVLHQKLRDLVVAVRARIVKRHQAPAAHNKQYRWTAASGVCCSQK